MIQSFIIYYSRDYMLRPERTELPTRPTAAMHNNVHFYCCYGLHDKDVHVVPSIHIFTAIRALKPNQKKRPAALD